MINLLEETKADIQQSGHTVEQIAFIGSRETGHQCTWAEFEKLADREYDSGCGAQEVASDLEIVFKDGATMWREEYDGSERWSYTKPFQAPTDSKPILRLFADEVGGVGWMDLEALMERQTVEETPKGGNDHA